MLLDLDLYGENNWHLSNSNKNLNVSVYTDAIHVWSWNFKQCKSVAYLYQFGWPWPTLKVIGVKNCKKGIWSSFEWESAGHSLVLLEISVAFWEVWVWCFCFAPFCCLFGICFCFSFLFLFSSSVFFLFIFLAPYDWAVPHFVFLLFVVSDCLPKSIRKLSECLLLVSWKHCTYCS